MRSETPDQSPKARFHANTLNTIADRLQRVRQLCALLCRIPGADFWRLNNLPSRYRADGADRRLLRNDGAFANCRYL